MAVINFPSRKLNKKKITIFIVILTILFILLITSIIYMFNSSFRRIIDIYIFRKEIASDKLTSIEIDSNEDHFFYAYDKYITLLKNNILYAYNSSGQVVQKINVNIYSPIFASNNKFLTIAENNGNTIYLLSGTNIIWQNTLDGYISKISINKNGYVCAIISGTSYKSIIVSFDSKGKELFKTYISNNIAISAEISNDNKYLSIAEIDYSGSIIKSLIKNISVEKAKTDPTNSVIYTYELSSNSLLVNIQYHDKNKLTCICNDAVLLLDITNSSEEEIIKIDKKQEFIDINLKNNVVYTENQTHGLTNDSIINIFNIQNNAISKYQFKGSIKSIFTNGDKIALNTGSEIHFIGTNGWLIKKYESYNEINDIILGDNIAGIMYKDKIKIIEI